MGSSWYSTVIVAIFAFLQIMNCSGAPPNTVGSFDIGPKIINGVLAERNDTRHQVSIRRKLNDGYFFGAGHLCGGSLITSTVVLSAAHCFVNYNSEENEFLSAHEFIVVIGNLDRFLQDDDTLSYDISHILYDVPKLNLSTYETDIALVFMRGTVPESHPIARPILLNRKTLPGGTICQVTGWGVTEEGYLADFLMSLDVPIIPNDICSTEAKFNEGAILDGMMCAGYLEGERDACQGDSGGPLVCNNVLAGIVSWGVGCALPNLPGVYTDVRYFVPWIKAHIEAAGGSLPDGNTGTPSSFRGSLTLLTLLAAFVISLAKF